MIGNYVMIALRNLRKHFTFSMINIAGLSLGLSTCLLLMIWIRHELSYDKFHTNYENLYRVSLEYSFGGQVAKTAQSPTALLPTLEANFAEVEKGTRYYNPASFGPFVVNRGDQTFEETKFLFADSTFFDVFTFPLLKGDPNAALTAPNSIVLTASTAKKYFGTEDPMGQVLRVNNRWDLTVTGVTTDVPHNSLIQFDFIGSFSTIDASKSQIWWSANYQTYVVLPPNANIAAIQDKTNELVKKALANEITNAGDYVIYNFMPMKDIYLRSDINEVELTGSIEYVYIFSAIAILILVIACINYVNLATAKAADRAREVGVRKVVGALRKQLVTQFIGESIVITTISFLLALLLTSIAIPMFNELTGKYFAVSTVLSPTFLIVSTAVILALAGTAGIYPAMVITGFKPVNILKGNFKTSGGAVWLRKSLVVFQFATSIVLIIGTVVIVKQIDYVRNKRLGYDQNNVIQLPMDRTIRPLYNQIKTEFLRSGHIASVGRAAEAPVRIGGGYSINIEGGGERGMITTALPIDEGFVSTMGMEIISGRDVTEADMNRLATDTLSSFIVNEKALAELGLGAETAVGTSARVSGRRGTIIGVVRDFHFAPMHEEIAPLVLFTETSQLNYIFARILPGHVDNSYEDLKAVYKTLVPHRPFEFDFLNDRYNAMYESEQRMGAICSVFATLAIIIACLGLLGLVAFAASQKTKEIGIRKVMGATAPGIVVLITKDFIKLVLIAIVVGVPLSWYIMDQHWLVNFAYRTDIGLWPFLLASAGCIIVALGTASYQAIKAAYVNPAQTLRNE
jgi:putative ABC transport system permease protein